MKLHMYKSHGVGEIYRCEVCNFETSSKAVFTKHEAGCRHPDEMDGGLECESEGLGVPRASQGGLEAGGRPTSSSGGKKAARFVCTFPDCVKAFKSRKGFTEHLQQHTDTELHRCMVCAYKTPQVGPLNFYGAKIEN